MRTSFIRFLNKLEKIYIYNQLEHVEHVTSLSYMDSEQAFNF